MTHQSLAVDQPIFADRKPNLAPHLSLQTALPISEPFFAEDPHAVACLIFDVH